MKFGGNAQPFVSPRLEDIAEMTVQTDQLDLNQGFGQANMQINFVTRRGTNQFHGRAFEDFQNSVLNANSWLNDAEGLPKSRLILNNFGGSVGGPILKDKLFFFGSFSMSKQPGSFNCQQFSPHPGRAGGQFHLHRKRWSSSHYQRPQYRARLQSRASRNRESRHRFGAERHQRISRLRSRYADLRPQHFTL